MAASFTDSFNVAQAAAMCLAEARRGSQIRLPLETSHAPSTSATPGFRCRPKPPALAGRAEPALADSGLELGLGYLQPGSGSVAAPPELRTRATRMSTLHSACDPDEGPGGASLGTRVALAGSLSEDEQRVLVALMMLRSVY